MVYFLIDNGILHHFNEDPNRNILSHKILSKRFGISDSNKYSFQSFNKNLKRLNLSSSHFPVCPTSIECESFVFSDIYHRYDVTPLIGKHTQL